MDRDKQTDRQTVLQESEYRLPYHHLPVKSDKGFRQSAEWSWGYQYLAASEVLLEELQNLSFRSLIDIGCGDGRLLQIFAAEFPSRNFLGVDNSRRSILLANAMNFQDEVQYLERDLVESQIQKKFDVATLIEVLEHIHPDDVHKFVESVADTLVHSGSLIVTVPSENKKLSKKHYQHFTVEKLTSILVDSGFEIAHFKFLAKNGKLARRIIRYMKFAWRHFPDTKFALHLYNIYKQRLFAGAESNTDRILVLARKT